MEQHLIFKRNTIVAPPWRLVKPLPGYVTVTAMTFS